MIEWINSPQQSLDLIERIKASKSAFIGLDTEFVRRSSFFADPGLLQISWNDGKTHVALVDLVNLKQKAIRHLLHCLYTLSRDQQATLVMHAPAEDLQIFDYYGFPPESYEIQYPCKGNPELAQKVIKAGEAQGIAIKANLERGFDHGLFVPMKILFPEADVSCIQVSLNSNLDAQTHLKLGKILKSVLDDDVLLIGSGFSFHNMRSFFKPQSHEEIELNMAFENWLTETMTSPHLSEEERRSRFIEWDATKGARYCHPREEHLLPLHVCYGAMQQSASRAMRLPILGVSSSMYLWS